MRKDVREIGSFYESALAERGVNPIGVGYNTLDGAAIRFEVLLGSIDFRSYSPESPLKLLDLGCGPGFLLDYLAKNNLLDRIDYTGVDVTEVTLEPARTRWPGYRFEIRDVRDEPFPESAFDFCIACGVFTSRYDIGFAETRDLVEETLKAIWPSVRLGLAFNVMSKHVDWERDDLFHWPLDDIMAFCKKNLSRHVTLRLDFGPWETSASVLRTPVRRRSQVPQSWLVGQAKTHDQSNNQIAREALAINSVVGSVTGCPPFDYAKGRPNLYLLMRFKQALTAALGVQRAFAVYRHTLAVADSGQILLKLLESERSFAEARSEAFVEVAPGGQRFRLEPPLVIGEGNHRQLEGVTRSFYVTCLGEARVRGRSALIEACGMGLLDYQDTERSHLDDELEWDPAIFHLADSTDSKVWVLVPQADISSVELNSAFTLLGAHTDFFGHWMCEYLPKYIAARLSGSLPSVPVLIDADMPEQHRQALELLFPDQIELIEVPAFKTVRVRRLWSAPSLMYMPLHEKRNERFNWDLVAASPDRFAPIIREMVYRADFTLGKPIGSMKVYLARRDFRHRRLVNCAGIEGVAASRGFAIVYPEELSFADQVALIRTAKFIIAPEGSAIFLVFFAVLGAKLCILSHPLTDVLADYHGIFSVHGIQTIAMTGPIVRENDQVSHDSDYEIDEMRFSKFLDQWLDEAGPDSS